MQAPVDGHPSNEPRPPRRSRVDPARRPETAATAGRSRRGLPRCMPRRESNDGDRQGARSRARLRRQHRGQKPEAGESCRGTRWMSRTTRCRAGWRLVRPPTRPRGPPPSRASPAPGQSLRDSSATKATLACSRRNGDGDVAAFAIRRDEWSRPRRVVAERNNGGIDCVLGEGPGPVAGRGDDAVDQLRAPDRVRQVRPVPRRSRRPRGRGPGTRQRPPRDGPEASSHRPQHDADPAPGAGATGHLAHPGPRQRLAEPRRSSGPSGGPPERVHTSAEGPPPEDVHRCRVLRPAPIRRVISPTSVGTTLDRLEDPIDQRIRVGVGEAEHGHRTSSRRQPIPSHGVRHTVDLFVGEPGVD